MLLRQRRRSSPFLLTFTSDRALGIGPLFKGWLLLSPPTASKMDPLMGLEPTTSPFGGECSYPFRFRLSYSEMVGLLGFEPRSFA